MVDAASAEYPPDLEPGSRSLKQMPTPQVKAKTAQIANHNNLVTNRKNVEKMAKLLEYSVTAQASET